MLYEVITDGYRGVGWPLKFGRTPGSARCAPKRFGADNREVLMQAGYSDSDIEALIASGVIVMERRS